MFKRHKGVTKDTHIIYIRQYIEKLRGTRTHMSWRRLDNVCATRRRRRRIWSVWKWNKKKKV